MVRRETYYSTKSTASCTSCGVPYCSGMVTAGVAPTNPMSAMYSSIFGPFSKKPSLYVFTPPFCASQ